VNSFERKGLVAPVEQLVAAGELEEWEFPCYSVTGLEMRT
jgi:hypothetical protein